MKIVIIGRGNVGGALAEVWRTAGHDVTALGRDGGDASGADVLVIAVHSDAIDSALSSVTGLGGQITLDATNADAARTGDHPSLTHQVKAIVGGPAAKAFNLNFAALFDRAGEESARPSNPFAAEPAARPVTEELIRDAGFDPVYAGGIEAARGLEDAIALFLCVAQAGMGPCFYRFATPGNL